ncbi:unnamed protein product [Paramecium octaurelia]|uniref:Uncharacterized protein n=1 Tax=Paramecium octaurelia TaxID=43137 RepID=A0A8S1SM58_PAROT|nr:unnamed protein product [Paramecium octaurelia]
MFNYSQYEEEINHPQYRTRVRYQDKEAKRNLNGQLDVTCFLMAVEIQRLIAENTELKITIKQQSDSGLDRINYEMQIRDLMEKLQQLQQDNYKIGSDNERLRKLIRDYEVQLQRQETQLRDYDPNWKKELEQQKKQLVQLQKKIGDDDVDDLRSQLNKLKKKLGDYEKQFNGKTPEELQRMLDDLQRKAKQLDDIQNKIGGMDPDTLAKKLKELEKLQKSFGGSPEDLLKELERTKKKAKDADDLKKELDRQLRENDKQKNDLDVLDDLRKNAQNLQLENGQLNQQLNDLKNKLRDADQLRLEIEQYKELLKKKEQEIAYLKNQLSDQQRQLQDTQRQLQDQLRQLGDLQQRIRSAEQDKLRLQSELNNCLDELDSADGQKEAASQLKDENDKLNQEVDQLNDDKNRLSNENEELRNRLNDLMRQIQDKDNKLKDLQQDINKKNSELKDLGNKLKEANDKIEWIKNEFGLTDDDLDPKKRKLNAKNIKENILFSNIQPSNLLLNFLLQSAEIERLGIIIDKYYSENDSLQNQVKTYKQKNEQISQQLQQQLILQSQMTQDNEIEKLKEYYENKIVMLTMEVSRLKKQQTYSSYQSIPVSHKLQPRPNSQNFGDISETPQIQPKREEDLLSLIVLMGVEIQHLRDQNSTLILQTHDKDVIKGLLTTSGYESQSKTKIQTQLNEYTNNYENNSQRDSNKGLTRNSFQDFQNNYTQINNSSQQRVKTTNDSRQNDTFNLDRITSQQIGNGSQKSYQYQAQIPYKYDHSSQLSGSGSFLKVGKLEQSKYVN